MVARLVGLRPFVVVMVSALTIVLNAFTATVVPAGGLEQKVRGTMLYNVTLFTHWPEESFRPTGDTLVVAVLDDRTFATILRDVFRDELIQGRPCRVLDIDRLEDSLDAHVLFVPAASRDSTERIVGRVEGRPILTVGDASRFCRSGGMVGLSVESGRVRLEINPDAARSRNLTFSSKLLALATIVDGRRPRRGGSR